VDGREKPELSAPGHQVLAARSRTTAAFVAKSGTSMAAPAVAGVLALLLAEAHRAGASLPSAAIRAILLNSTRRNPPGAAGWNAQYGLGRLSARQAFGELAQLSGSGADSSVGGGEAGSSLGGGALRISVPSLAADEDVPVTDEPAPDA
jgi:subtilisin family serine protease